MTRDNIVKGNFESGFSLGDRRAVALHNWIADLGRPATVEEMKVEIERLKKIMPAPEDMPEGGFKITSSPEWDAVHAFDAENNVEPVRTVAERLALKWSSYYRPDMVDDISHALEDAMDIGKRRGPLESAALAASRAGDGT